MAEATAAQRAAVEEILRPPSAKNLEAVRARRYEVKDILNTTLLHPAARERYERLYAELGRILEEAAAKAAS